MTPYIIRRVLLVFPTLLGVSLIITGVLRLLPGDAVDILASQGELQGAAQIYRELIDGRLTEDGVDPVGATATERRAAELAILGEHLAARNMDIAAASDADIQAARSELALEAFKDDIREKTGLDRGYIAQWASWLSHAARLDFGDAIGGGPSVNAQLRSRVPVSIELGAIAILVALFIALPAGVISAMKQDTWLDYGARGFAISMLALPSFLLATVIIGFFAHWFGYSFPFNYSPPWSDLATNLELVLVPGILLGIGLSGTLLRITRAQMLDVLRQDYIRTARAKGLANTALVIRHGVRNAMIPVITVIGLQVPVLIGGSVVLESIFGIPGVAQYLLVSINNREFPAILAINVLAAAVIILSNLVVDVAYALLDPRVRVS